MDTREIGARIRALREQRGWTLREISRRVGLSPSYFSRLEDGYTDPRLADLKLIAQTFGVPLATVTGEEDVSDEMAKRLNAYPTFAPKIEALMDFYEWSDETKRGLIESLLDVFMQMNAPTAPQEPKRSLTERQSRFIAKDIEYARALASVSQ